MYPEQARWNYKNFVEAFERIAHERALFRGAVANGLRIGALCSVMTGIHDYIKEHMYYYFGPIMFNRLLATTCAVTAGVSLSMPFDTIRTRMHIMRPLPNGQLPYENSIDCLSKVGCFLLYLDHQVRVQSDEAEQPVQLVWGLLHGLGAHVPNRLYQPELI